MIENINNQNNYTQHKVPFKISNFKSTPLATQKNDTFEPKNKNNKKYNTWKIIGVTAAIGAGIACIFSKSFRAVMYEILDTVAWWF